MIKKELNRKERERLFKKQEILDASIKLFAQKGFKATTLDEIAEKSEFGKGTIYNYFSSKEKIYKEIIMNVLDTQKNSIVEVYNSTETLYDLVYRATKNDLTFCLKNKDAFILLAFTKMHHEKSTTPEISNLMDCGEKEIMGLIIDRTETAIKNKEIRNLTSNRIIRLFKTSGFSYIYDLLIHGNLTEESIDDETKFITDILFNGISIK